jgi:hypothetical protein
MFGQIPATLEDIWINIATNNKEKAMGQIDMILEKNPFKLKYEERLGRIEDWIFLKKYMVSRMLNSNC